MTVIVIGLHGGAGVLLFLLPWPWWGALAVLAVVLFSGWRSARLHGWRQSPDAVTAVEFIDVEGKDESVYVQTLGLEFEGRLAGAFIHSRLVILRIKPLNGRGTITVVLAEDAVAPEVFRQLRVRLRQQIRAG